MNCLVKNFNFHIIGIVDMKKTGKFLGKVPRAKGYISLSILITTLIQIIFKGTRKDKKTKLLEGKIKDHFGVKNAILLPRARIALFYLLKNLNLPQGSEVILTPLTVADIPCAVHWARFKPVFCDLGKQTYNIDCQKLEQLITPKTKVLIVTHLNGIASDMDKIMSIAGKHNLILIEDASQVLNAKFRGKLLGTFGRAGIFSLSFLKSSSTLFGGLLILNDSSLSGKIRQLSEQLPPAPRLLLVKETIKNIILAIATNRIIFSFFTYYAIKVARE